MRLSKRVGALAVVTCLAAGIGLDGRSIRAAGPATAIFVMKTNGSQVRKVAQAPGFERHSAPQWSHDGKRLAFDAKGGANGGWKIFVVNVDGSGLKEMGEQGMPHWSPDDKQLTFHNDNSASTRRGIWVKNLDGKGANWVRGGTSPRWSPDGSRMVYRNHRFALSVADLVDGSERTLMEGSYEILPGFDWSPDGKRLAIVQIRDGQRELFLVENDGGMTMRLTRQFMGGYMSWSPDGKQLAFSLMHLIHVMTVDGDAGPQLIPGQAGINEDPAWSPDGQWIAFASNRPDA